MGSNFGKKKKYILIICIVAAFLMSGYLFYTPELKNADKPFIDLTGSVGQSLGNAKEAYAVSTPGTPASAGTEVIVAGESITVGNYFYQTTESFERAVNNGKFKGEKIRLIDDYAEVKTFKKTLKILKKAGLSYEIETR